MRHKKHDFRTAYIDLLINVLTGMVFLFMLTTLLIQTKVKEDEGIKKDAQYVITATWDNLKDCDVDIWVQDPKYQVVSFQRKEAGVMHIERDDQGWHNDMIQKPDGSWVVGNDLNQETWVLRGKVPGKYTVNLHLYSCRSKEVKLELGTKMETLVTVELTKLNPRIEKVAEEKVLLKKIWDETTVFNFQLDNNGNLILPITRDQIDLVKENYQ